MSQNDDKLSNLLRQWRGVEPPGNFEANVRRRIRLAAEQPRKSWLAGLLWRPALAAAVLSILIGSSAGILSARPQQPEMQFMSAGTLAGGYSRGTR
jgi:hypothetical protein